MCHAGRARITTGVVIAALGSWASSVAASDLGPEQLVRADGMDIVVPGYSVPSFVHFDGDDLRDLVIGEGGGGVPEGKVRVYPNVGTATQPMFVDFFYVTSLDADLVCDAAGCMGVFPRVVYWDADGRKDLLAGQAGGTILLFTNIGTDDDPHFDGGVALQVGEPGSKADIDVGARATPAVVDWNNDGRKDLVVGALDGLVRIYINEGTDDAPDFRTVSMAREDGADLIVPSGRSSPRAVDYDLDGKKDIVAGNTNATLVFYRNIGSDDSPEFTAGAYVNSYGVPIDLPGSARSRPFDCDWTRDGAADFLIGAGDGLVRLYEGTEIIDVDPADPWANHAGSLFAAYPNPTSSSQIHRVDLPGAADVRMRVFDVHGRVVSTLVDAKLPAGPVTLTWEPIDREGRRLPRGIYIIRLHANGRTDTRKVALLR